MKHAQTLRSSVITLAPKKRAAAPAEPPAETEEVIEGAGETQDESHHPPKQWAWLRHRRRSRDVLVLTRKPFARCAKPGEDTHYLPQVGQFVRHMLEDVGYTCELQPGEQGPEANMDGGEEEDQEGNDHQCMRTRTEETEKRGRTTSHHNEENPQPERATSSGDSQEGGRRGLREDDLTAEDLATMRACEEDVVWQTLRGLRLMVQEVVESPEQADRFRN